MPARQRSFVAPAAALAIGALASCAWAQASAPAAAVQITAAPASAPAAPSYCPPIWSAIPFVALLVAIAFLPLLPRCEKLWHRNRNKLLVSLALSAPVLLYYYLAHPAMPVHEADGAAVLAPGLPVLGHVLSTTILKEYFPFIVLLLSLYTIGGGIRLTGDLPAHPRTNTAFLAAGAVLASFVGTTGAAMLLIRPLLATNAERKHKRHTIVFFIFIVCNIGGCLLPIGDPPLFLGYLRGVPFFWTLRLAGPWAVCCAILLAVYYIWDTIAYRKETPARVLRDETHIKPLRLTGTVNLIYLLAVLPTAMLLVPGKPFALYEPYIVEDYVREGAMLLLVAMSLATTPKGLRKANRFTFSAIAEVAALFVGIFITMQAPIEILRHHGPGLGLDQPWQFFWASGTLSSFLDNAPTYVVFFETADSLTKAGGPGILQLVNGSFIRVDLLVAVSLGSVFMGANTYIGNGPNFMVKALAEEHGVKMPSFLGYMLYSACILVPIFILLTLTCFVWKLF